MLDDAPPQPPSVDDLEALKNRYSHVMEHVQIAIDESDMPLTEEQLWNLMARTYSVEWAEADATLQRATQKMLLHDTPDNRPMGSIGMALEGEVINELEEEAITALAHFTVVDEELHQDNDLNLLLLGLVNEQKLVERSLGISNDVFNITQNLNDITSTPDRSLGETFGFFAKGLFRKKKAAV